MGDCTEDNLQSYGERRSYMVVGACQLVDLLHDNFLNEI